MFVYKLREVQHELDQTVLVCTRKGFSEFKIKSTTTKPKMKFKQKCENNQIKRACRQHKELPRMAKFGKINK